MDYSLYVDALISDFYEGSRLASLALATNCFASTNSKEFFSSYGYSSKKVCSSDYLSADPIVMIS